MNRNACRNAAGAGRLHEIFDRPLMLLRIAPLFAILIGTLSAAEPANAGTLNWLGGAAPEVAGGVSWGVAWPKGAVHASDVLTLRTAGGKPVPMQTWPLAYWPGRFGQMERTCGRGCPLS